MQPHNAERYFDFVFPPSEENSDNNHASQCGAGCEVPVNILVFRKYHEEEDQRPALVARLSGWMLNIKKIVSLPLLMLEDLYGTSSERNDPLCNHYLRDIILKLPEVQNGTIEDEDTFFIPKTVPTIMGDFSSDLPVEMEFQAEADVDDDKTAASLILFQIMEELRDYLSLTAEKNLIGWAIADHKVASCCLDQYSEELEDCLLNPDAPDPHTFTDLKLSDFFVCCNDLPSCNYVLSDFDRGHLCSDNDMVLSKLNLYKYFPVRLPRMRSNTSKVIPLYFIRK